MSAAPWISLTTDYGLADGFVAACHGVIARIAPAARVIDVTHLVPPADVRRGAAVLAQTVPYLPVGVHVAVVDPGVGTARRGIALATPGGLLVGPDNGLLPGRGRRAGRGRRGGRADRPGVARAPRSPRTFHGRDVFAPVAARLALGAPLAEAGPPVDPAALVRLPAPVLPADADGFDRRGADRGPLRQRAARRPGRAARPAARDGPGRRAARPEPAPDGRRRRGRPSATSASGALVVYVDSAGLVAVAVNGGRAVDLLAVAPATSCG